MTEESSAERPEHIPLPPSVASSEYSGDAEPLHMEEAPPKQQSDIVERLASRFPLAVDDPSAHQSEELENKATAYPEDVTKGEPASLGDAQAQEHIIIQEDFRNQEGPQAETTSHEIPIPLLELLGLIHKDTYEQMRYQALQSKVSSLLFDCGINGRFIPIQYHLYRRMVDCYRSDKKTVFASLYAQSLDLGKSSDSSVLKHSELVESPPGAPQDPSVKTRSWIQSLPSSSGRSILKFLKNVRNDSLFLADRISRLSSSQLSNLARPHKQLTAIDSVLHASPVYSKFDPRNFHRSMAKSNETLPSTGDLFRDPMVLLLHGLFDSSSPWGSFERLCQLEIWASVCAKVIEDGKAGSDEFCLTVLDAFAEFTPWAIKPELEMFLMDLVHSGDFLVDSHASQSVDFSQDRELHNARIAVATAEFFENALLTLVGLITRPAPQTGVPQASLDLIRAILEKIQDPEKKAKARSFFISRWYSTSFLSNALLFPEVNNIFRDVSQLLTMSLEPPNDAQLPRKPWSKATTFP